MATTNKRSITLEILGDAKSLTQSAQAAQRELAKLEAIKLQTKTLGVDFDPAQVQAQLAKLDALKQAKLVLTADVDIANAQRELDKLGTASSEAFKAKWQAAGDSLSSIGQRMSVGISAPIVAGFGLATKAAAEYEDQLNVVTETFGPLAGQIQTFADTATSAFGLSKREAIEVASSFGLVLDKTELSKQAVADYSKQLAGLSGDLSSFFGKSTEQASAAIRSGLIGESEPLRAFGVILSENAVKAKAYASGIAEAGAELTESQKIQARYQLILEQTSKATGDFARTSDSAVNATKTAKKELENAAVTLGQTLTPAMATGAKAVAGLAEKFGDLPKGVQQGIVVVGGFAAALGPIFTVAGNAAKGISAIKGAVDGLKGADGEITRMGKAVAGLGVAATVVGGFLALKAALDAIDAKKQKESFEELSSVLNRQATKELDNYTAAVSRASAAGGVLGDKALAQLTEHFESFTKAARWKDAQDLIDSLQRVGASEQLIAKFAATMKRAQEETAGAARQAEASSKVIVTQADAMDALAKVTGAATGSARTFGETMESVAEANAKAELETAKLTRSINDANEKVVDARRKVVEAAQESAEKIAEAEQGVARAKKDAAERYAEAVERQREVAEQGAERIADAERKVADAATKGAADVAKAKQDAADAVAKATQELVDADIAMGRAAIEGAAKVDEAQRNLAEVTEETAQRVVDAERGLVRAREDAAADVADAVARQVQAEERGAERIEDATRAIADAHRDGERAVSDAVRRQQEAVEDAAVRIAEAEQRVAQAAEEGAERVKAAKESAAEAAENAADRIAATEKSAADQTKSADKNVAQARKDRDKAIKESGKDVTKAEKDYAEAVKKSGVNSEQARDAAERLAEVRERAAERVQEANDRVAEAEERAADARVKAEQDVAKAKKDGAKAAEENAKRVEKAEKDAADGVAKAESDLAKARAEAAKAQQDAAANVARAQEEAATRIAAAEAGLESARKLNDADRIKAAADVADAEKAGREKVEEAEDRLKKTQIQSGKDRQAASDELARVIRENSEAEIEWQGKITEAQDAKAKAEAKGIDDVRLAEKTAAEERESASTNLAKVIEASEKANRKSSDDTRKVVETNTEAIGKAIEGVGEARKTAAETARKAEEDLNGAIDDQKVKLQEAGTQVGLLRDAYVSNVDEIIGKVRDLSREIGLIPNIPSPSGDGGGGSGAPGDPIIVNNQTDNQSSVYAPPPGAPADARPGDTHTDTNGVTWTSEGNNQWSPVGGVQGSSGNSTSFGDQNLPSNNTQNPGAFNGASAGAGTSGPAGAQTPSPSPSSAGTPQGPAAPGSPGPTLQGGNYVGNGNTNNAKKVAVGDWLYNDEFSADARVRALPVGSKQTLPNNYDNNPAGYSYNGTTWTKTSATVWVLTALKSGSTTTGLPAGIAGAIATARAQIGKPYVWGAKGPNSFDCSGLTWYAYKSVGIDIGQGTINQINSGLPAKLDDIRAGDLVFWRGGSPARDKGHVVLAISSTQCISAPRTGSNVQIQSINKSSVQAVRRIVATGGGAQVNLSDIPANGIPTNAGSSNISPGGESGMGSAGSASGLAEVGGDRFLAPVNGGGLNAQTPGINASLGTPGGGIAASLGTPTGAAGTIGTYIAPGGGGPTIIGSPQFADPSETGILRQRATGAQLEAQVQARRREMVALEGLALALRNEELAKQEGITDSKELERLHAEVVRAQTEAAAAEEGKIRADREAGMESEKSSAESRATGQRTEEEIERLRRESEALAGINLVDGSIAAGKNIVGASIAAGFSLAHAMEFAAQAASRTGDNAKGGSERWTPTTWDGEPLPESPPPSGGGGGTDGSGATGYLDQPSREETINQVVATPLIIQMDGRNVAEYVIEFTRKVARYNGDKTADGALRLTRR